MGNETSSQAGETLHALQSRLEAKVGLFQKVVESQTNTEKLESDESQGNLATELGDPEDQSSRAQLELLAPAEIEG